MDAQLLPLLAASSFPLNRLVLEVTEHTSVSDYGPVVAVRQVCLGQHGIRVSVDDASAGYASLRHIVTLAPDLIKIDRSLICGVDKDYVRRSMVGAVVMFARRPAPQSSPRESRPTASSRCSATTASTRRRVTSLPGPAPTPVTGLGWRAPAPEQVPRDPATLYVSPPTG